MTTAQTTTAINACDVEIWLDNLAGTLQNISGSSNNVTLNFSQALAIKRTFGSKWGKRYECPKDASMRLVITYSTASNEALDILKNWFFAASPGSRTCKVYIPDKNVGSDVYSGEWKIESLDIPANAGEADPVTVTANLVSDGEITNATNAT